MVAPSFNDLSLAHDKNLIRMSNTAQSMRHDESGTTLREAGECALNLQARHWIKRARRFVKQEKSWTSYQRAREANKLSLT